jgi:tetratricopeptide (TPR) repeat protein
MLLWVNSHGGFVFGLFFVALIAAGEWLSTVFRLPARLDARTARHFFTAMLLCAAAVLVTPYGWAYPAQLFSELILHRGEQVQEYRTVMAYQSILHPDVRGLHLVEYMALSAGVLAVLLWGTLKRGQWSWPLLFAALGMGALSTQFIRTTYFWGVFSVFACMLLLGRQERVDHRDGRAFRRYVAALGVLLFVAVAGREAYHALCKPLHGFWVNYYSPVEEAEYIREHLKGYRLGNNYNSGAYLLWALWPGQKVFIDARYFPYRQWYREYGHAVYGRDDRVREAFLDRYGCDAWCTTYEYDHLSSFVRSPRWELAHYGPSACIFVRKGRGISPDKDPCHPAVFTVKPHQKLRILDLMLLAGDLDHAFAMGRTFEARRFCPSRNIQAAAGCVKAGEALGRAGRLDDAIACFERAVAIRPGLGPEVLTNMGNLHLRKGSPGKAVALYLEALEVKPDHAPAMGNAANAYAMQGDYDRALHLLHRLREIRPHDPGTEYNLACVYARQGKVDEAVRSLRAAMEKGFADKEILMTDPDLANIRGTEFYRGLVK